MNIIRVKHLANYLGTRWVHDDLCVDFKAGDISAIVGGSGCGKTTLLRTIMGLQKPKKGQIEILGQPLMYQGMLPPDICQTMGVMFQQGALFSALTVQQNIAFPLRLHFKIKQNLAMELALLKLSMVGLPRSAATQYPAQLSGGMVKRAAVARAIALDPTILCLDEPTAGLDPKGASELDELILTLRSSMKLSIILVTHDMDTLWRIADQVAFLADGKVIQQDTMANLAKSQDQRIRAYFNNARARAAAV